MGKGNQTNHSKIYNISFAALALLSVAALAIALSPKLNKSFKAALLDSPRSVLSTAKGKLFDGRPIEVVKVKMASGLFIEVYDLTDENVHPLLDRIKLPDLKDGFMIFQGEAVNLAIHDVDGDNHNEIIAPSFDKNLVAHLNVYRFNKITNKFELKKIKN